MQGLYFFVKFGLVLIYTLKAYHKKSSSILLRKNMFNSWLPFFFWKACVPSHVLRDFSFENVETTPRFIYLELLIIGVVF